MTYYKVLCKGCFGELCSVSGRFSTDISYFPHEVMKPTLAHSKLFVFDTLENAQRAGYGSQIWACKVTNPHKIKKIVDNAFYSSCDLVRDFWLKKKSRKSLCKIPLMKAPEGTLVCDSVKLTKFIKMV